MTLSTKTLSRGLIVSGLVLVASLGLRACAPQDAAPVKPAPTAPTAKPASQSPKPAKPVASRDPDDMCEAKSLQYLVGKSRSDIPVPLDPSKRRVTCTTCPMTMDFRFDRVNILFDKVTGIIKEVRCG
jgi:hypothetical protein